jgi:ACS family glucarate transporter-like MFS transporter
MTSKPWALVALLSATATASYLCRVNVSVAAVLLMRDFQMSQVAMGRLFSAFVLGYAIAQVPAGMFADRWGTPRVLVASAAAWVALTAMQAVVGLGPIGRTVGAAVALLFVLRFALGVTEAPTFPAAARGVARWIRPESQGRANGIVLAAIAVGSAIAPPSIAVMMTRWGWRTALVGSSLPALAAALVWIPIARREAPVRIHESRAFARSRLRSRSFVLLTASYTLQGYVGYIFVFWFYLYLVQERHFDLLRSGWLASLPWALSLISIPLGGVISDHLVRRIGLVWGRRLVPVFGLAAAAACTALGAHAANAYIAALVLAAATASVLSVEGPFWATLIEVEGAETATAGGIMNMGSNIGGLISPALTPVIAARAGWENALYVAAALALAAAIMWLGITPAGVGPAPPASSAVPAAAC